MASLTAEIFKRATITIVSLALISVAFVCVLAADGTDDRAADLVNAYRATRGLPRLPADASLNVDARRWVEHLADTNSLSHDALELNDWTTLGENVGRGVNIEVIEKAFEDSPSHEHNLVGNYTHLGVAVAARGNTVWVVQRFGTRTVVPTTPTTVPVTLAPTTTTVTLAPPVLCLTQIEWLRRQ